MPFDKSQFIEQFKTETRERLQRLVQGILELEKKPNDKEVLEVLMREAHSIKGSATMLGFKRISELTHKAEDIFDMLIANENYPITKEHFDLLLKCIDAIEPLLEDKLTWKDKKVERPYVENLCKEMDEKFLKQVGKDESAEGDIGSLLQKAAAEVKSKKEVHKQKTPVPESAPQAATAVSDAPEPAAKNLSFKKSVRVDVEKLDRLMNLSGELTICRSQLDELSRRISLKVESESRIDDILKGLSNDLMMVNENVTFLTSEVQSEVMKVRMIPISFLFNTFLRSMRDLAQSKNKEIDLIIDGGDTELDKSIVDEMKDPIMHLLRNAIDHGLEYAEERKVNDKDQVGTISLKAYQRASQVIIEVSDDGRGIDIEKVKQQALKKGLFSEEKINNMDEDQIIQLLFIPGFSTKDSVTDISGRGVGLDVVWEKVSKLKGIIEVSSKLLKGTKFIIRLPLTLAIRESLLVAVGRDTFAIPIDSVVETIRINPNEINTIEGKRAITVRGNILPLIGLSELFNLPKKGIVERQYLPAVIVQSVERKVAILVDELLGREEIVNKSIGPPLDNVKNIMGATILGDGRVILILDIPSVIECSEGPIVHRAIKQAIDQEPQKKKKTILLAEDTLSTATLEKNILEAVGYSVVIARDGKEAFEKVTQEKFDLIITDVLMPRMSGFELTEKVKNDNTYKNIPVIVVTTRGSDSDKRRGLAAGADAYVLKSDFTSDLLLETIKRLLG